jgi:DNA-binding transcriptional ArsR family regulator
MPCRVLNSETSTIYKQLRLALPGIVVRRCATGTLDCSVFGIDRTPNSWHSAYVGTEILLVDAFAQLGVRTRQAHGAPDQGADLVIEPGGTRIQVKHRALVTDEVARRMLAETPRPSDSVLLVVGDRVTETARRLLVEQHAGYYDLRGHLALRSTNVVIDADVEPVSGRAERTHALSGRAGLEVATALLMEPAADMAVRELARRLGRSASTVSQVLAALRRADLINDRHRVEGTQLFWQVADRWPARVSTWHDCPCQATMPRWPSPCGSEFMMWRTRSGGRSRTRRLPWRTVRRSRCVPEFFSIFTCLTRRFCGGRPRF